jgi:hypothetical protein
MSMAGGLSPNQLRELVHEHGSIDAAIKARPDLAGHLRGVQRLAAAMGEQARAIARATESMRPALMRVPEQKPLLVVNKVDAQAAAFERALDRHDRRRMRQAASRRRKPREYTTQEIPRAMFIKAIRLLGEDAPISSRKKGIGIAEQTKLDRHLVSKVRDFTLGRGYQARPGQSSDTVVLVKVPKKAL